MEVHHTGECGGEAHPVRDRSVPVQSHHLVLLCYVVEEAGKRCNLSLFGLRFHLNVLKFKWIRMKVFSPVFLRPSKVITF